MRWLRSRRLWELAPALVLAGAPIAPSYAVSLPRPHDELVARSSPVAETTPFPTTGIPAGDAPAIPYAFASEPTFGGGDWRLRRPDGTAVGLPDLTWSVWAPMGQGAIGMAGTEAGPELQQVSGDGRVRSTLVQHFGLVVSPGDQLVGWLGDRGEPRVVEGGGSRTVSLPRVPHGIAVAALWGDDTCREQVPEGGGCSVFVTLPRRVRVTTSHGIVSTVGPLLRVSDVAVDGRVAGLVSRRTDSRPACWGVVRPDGRRSFRTCDYYLDSFSPGGDRILAEHSETRWSSIRRFAVLGRDGHVVRAWTFDPGRRRSLAQLTWEDGHHLLGVLLARGRWGLVRIGTDGTVEYAGPTVAATDELTPFSLPLR